MIVVDASALLEMLLRTPAATDVERRLSNAGWSLHAPHLIDVEVAQVIRRYVRDGDVDAVRGRSMIGHLTAFPMRRYPPEPFLPRIWDFRQNFTAYDAAYVTLAEALDAPLLTRDRRLAAAAGRHLTVDLV